MMFAKMELSELLGPATTPSALTMNVLDRTPAPFGAVIMNKTTNITMKLRGGQVPFRILWEETVATAFLKPFGLADTNAFMALDAGNVSRIVAENPQYAGMVFHTPQPGRCKNIIMG